jgi:hypothetical protein
LKITILVEGRTEKVFLPHVRNFLQSRLPGQMPNLDPFPYDGRIPKENKLKRVVENSLRGRQAADAVIALTDVYTGALDFRDAADAKSKMRTWVGNDPRFHPHAAQHDFEAWLLPYWSEIQKVAGHKKAAPSGKPEEVNHSHPPSHYVKEIFRIGTCGRDYSKTRDANRILQGKDLAIAAALCPELKAFLTTIISLSGGEPL